MSMKPTVTYIVCPIALSRTIRGAMMLPRAKTAIRPALSSSAVLAPPDLVGDQPGGATAPAQTMAPEHCTIRNSPAERSVKRVIQLIGKIVTRWNSAKAASGTKAPIRTRPPRGAAPARGPAPARAGPSPSKARELVGRHQPQAGEQGHDVDGEGAVERDSASPSRGSQPQIRLTRKNENRALATMKPEGAPSWDHRGNQPRRSRGAFSARSEASPSQAPPSASPWRMRSTAQEIEAGADLGVARQEGHRRGGAAEQEQRDRQLDAAAVPAVHGHEDHRADRPGDEGEAKTAKE